MDAREARFWGKVKKTGGCWLWTGPKCGNGYGQFRWEGGRRLAHRVAYEISHGWIPYGAHVCHRCDRPDCVRPDHLYAGTRSQNMREMIAKGRHWLADPERAVLSETTVQEIRQRYAAGGISQRALAREFGVTQSYVCQLVRGTRRRNVA